MNPILLLHGALGVKSQLDPLKLQLEQFGHQVYSLNFSYHGGESLKNKFGIEAFAEDVLRFLEDQKISHVNIFGYSMGGYVALWLAHIQPTLVDHIVTFGTKFDWSPASADKEIKKLNAEKILEKVPAFARILEHRHKPNDWKDLLRQTSVMMKALGDHPLLNEVVLRSVKTKTLICLGDQDDMADLEYSKEVSSILSNGDFKLLENTTHPIEKVDLAMLANLITEYFREDGRES